MSEGFPGWTLIDVTLLQNMLKRAAQCEGSESASFFILDTAVFAFIQTPISILTINLHSPLWRKATAESPACSLLSCPCAFHSVWVFFDCLTTVPVRSRLSRPWTCAVWTPLAAADRPETELCPSNPAVIASTVTASPLSNALLQTLQRWQFWSVWLIEQVYLCVRLLLSGARWKHLESVVH